jgi:hypothetical protein
MKDLHPKHDPYWAINVSVPLLITPARA